MSCNLKARFGHGYVDVDSIREITHPWRLILAKDALQPHPGRIHSYGETVYPVFLNGR